MNLTILGSTGAIGRDTLSVINKIDKKINIFALTAKSNIKTLYSQIKQFKPEYAVVLNLKDDLFRFAILGFALTEAIALFALMIAFLILFA